MSKKDRELRRRSARTTGSLLVVLLAALAIAVAGCGGDGDAADEPAGGEQVTAVEGDDTSPEAGGDSELVVLQEDIAPALDVEGATSTHLGTEEIAVNLMEPLVEFPGSGVEGGVSIPDTTVDQTEFEGRLAESYEKNGLTWTFHLRQGVMSCAGNELTADDVIYTFQRGKSVSGAVPVVWFLGNVSGIFSTDPIQPNATEADKQLQDTEVRKIDKYTVEVTQLQENALFPRVLEIWSLYIFDSVEMQKHATTDDPWARQYTETENMPGHGPYCLSQWSKGSEMVLEANPNYYRGDAPYDRIVIRKVPQVANRVSALQTGAADVVTALTAKEFSDLEGNDEVTRLGWINNQQLSVGFNFEFAPWDSENAKLLRQAIAYAIPYDEIIQEDFFGTATRWYGLHYPNSNGYIEIDKYNTDLDRARELLAQAGYPNGEGLSQFADGLTLYYVAERQNLLEPIANRIRSALGAIGIPITLAPISNAEFTDREVKRDMPMFIRDSVRAYGADVGYTTLLFYVSPENGAFVNTGNYRSTELDEEYAASASTVGEERLGHLERIQEILMEDLPLVPIALRPSEIAVRSGITCWIGNPDDLIRYWSLQPEDSSRPCEPNLVEAN